MATVVVIHAADDTLPARALAEKLRQAQLSVIIEKQPGEDLRNAIKSAAVTIALWSPRSVVAQPLIDEAAAARAKSKVVHAVMQSAQAPEQFRGEPVINLTGWRGEDDFPAWRELAQAVTSKAGVAPLPPPAPRPPSGFFQPGRVADAPAPAPQARPQQNARPQPTRAAPPPPPPRPQSAPRPAPEPRVAASDEPKKGGNGLVIGIIAVIALAAVGGGGYYFMTQQGAQSASAAWEEVDRGDPTALRAFIETASGATRSEAQAALSELEDRSYEAASDADTIESLQAFLGDFPDSEHAIAARGRIAELQTMQQTPIEGEVPPGELAPTDPNAVPNPDLVPPNATAPDSAGPATLTPPPAEAEPLPEPGTEAPTN